MEKKRRKEKEKLTMTTRRKERIVGRKARAKDAMAAEEVEENLLILKQLVGSTRITSGKIVLTITTVPVLFQGTKQLVVEDVVEEIQLAEEDMEAEELIIPRQL